MEGKEGRKGIDRKRRKEDVEEKEGGKSKDNLGYSTVMDGKGRGGRRERSDVRGVEKVLRSWEGCVLCY